MMITPPLLALAVSLGQLSVPFDVEVYSTSSCSTSERTGYVPFAVKLTCTNHPGANGCVATGRIDLSEVRGNEYSFMCERLPSQGPVEVQDAEVEISGIRYDLTRTGPDIFNQLKVQVEATNYDPATYLLDWRAVVNWKRWPSTMVEQFTAELFGEIVWTTNQDSRLIRGSGACVAPVGTSCTAMHSVLTWPSGWVYGGSALRGIEIESQAGQGILPMKLSADLTEVVKATGAKVAWECGLDDGNTPVSGLACGYSALSIVGAKTEVFRAWVGPFSRPSSPPAAYGFSVPFYPYAASRCALRSFTATSGGLGGPTDAIWFGAHSSDCGWSPGNVYNGVGVHGFEAGALASPEVEFSLDATRLP